MKEITEATKTTDFDYNADLQRIRMVLKTNGTATKTRYYFGGSCEREVIGSTTTQYIWIGGDAYTAVAVAKKVGSGSWTVYNIFRDHLGTITHLKNASAIDEYSFDAWGRRRDKDDWTYTLTSEPALFADRGFTGHEYLEDFKLYNMNGRLYDPVVGRFLSADPYIQDPGFTQSLNRYSYCLNNPLKYIDPSGNTWLSKFTQWAGETTNKLATWMNQHPTQIGYSSGGPNGPVIFVSTQGPGNTNIGVGVNTQTGQVGVGNNSSGFMSFYFPGYNYDVAAQNFVNKTLPSVRGRYGAEWRASGAGDIGTGLSLVGEGMWLFGESRSASLYQQGFRRGINGNYQLVGRNLSLFGDQPMNSATKPFTSLTTLGKGLSNVGTGLAVAGVAVDTYEYSQGNLSGTRYGYHLTGTGAAIGASYYLGGPIGAVTGGIFFLGEKAWDSFQPVWNDIVRQYWQFENAMNNGWRPR